MRATTLQLAVGALAAIFLAPLALADGHASPDAELITGKHWTTSDERAKIGYLYGIANFADIEQAMHGDDVPGDRDSLVPVLVRGMDGKTIDEVKMELDAWYANNPDRLERPVLETIWYELALPNS